MVGLRLYLFFFVNFIIVIIVVVCCCCCCCYFFYFHYANFQFYIFYPLILNFKSLPDSLPLSRIYYKQQKQEFKNLTSTVVVVPPSSFFFYSLLYFSHFPRIFFARNFFFATFQPRTCMSSLNKVKSFSLILYENFILNEM